jgi:hypothetical protein
MPQNCLHFNGGVIMDMEDLEKQCCSDSSAEAAQLAHAILLAGHDGKWLPTCFSLITLLTMTAEMGLDLSKDESMQFLQALGCTFAVTLKPYMERRINQIKKEKGESKEEFENLMKDFENFKASQAE